MGFCEKKYVWPETLKEMMDSVKIRLGTKMRKTSGLHQFVIISDNYCAYKVYIVSRLHCGKIGSMLYSEIKCRIAPTYQTSTSIWKY